MFISCVNNVRFPNQMKDFMLLRHKTVSSAVLVFRTLNLYLYCQILQFKKFSTN